MPEAEAPVTPLQEEPQTDPAVKADEPQPAPEAAPEKPPEKVEAGAEKKVEPPAWASITEVEGLREHVQPLLEESERRGYEKRSGEFDQYAQPYLQQHSQQGNNINAGVGRMLKGLEGLSKAAKSGETVDGDALSEWFDAHEDTLKAVTGQMQLPWEFNGAKRLLVSLADAVGDQSLATPFMGRLDMMASSVPDPNLFTDFVKKVSSKAVADATKPLEEKVTSLTAANEELKRRVTKGPDITPKGGGSTEDDQKLLLDPNTPIEKIKEIRARQKLAG